MQHGEGAARQDSECARRHTLILAGFSQREIDPCKKRGNTLAKLPPRLGRRDITRGAIE